MTQINRDFIYIILGLLILGCKGQSQSFPEFPSSPSRESFEGFHWEIVEGNGLKFWAERNKVIHMKVNDSGDEAGIVYDRDKKDDYFQMKIKVFPLPTRKIEDIIPLLQKMPEWDPTETCGFRKINSTRKGVTRYVLELNGESAENFLKKSVQEPIPSTCGGWGIGNSGTRYFEIHESNPDKLIFVEIGQEAPLFDEQSIVLQN